MTDANKQQHRAKLTAITDMLARRDNAALLALLDDNGGDADWCDDRGQTLLHFAAQRGDEELCEALVCKKGFSALVRNEDGDTPARVAALFGHERLAEHLAEIERTQQAGQPPATVRSLADVRAQHGKGALGNAFYRYACQQQFSIVVDAALRNDEAFTAADLLAMGQKGESVILRLCQSGQLPCLLRAELWRGAERQEVLCRVRDSLPRFFRAQIDASGLVLSAPAAGPGGLQGSLSPRGAHRFKLGPK